MGKRELIIAAIFIAVGVAAFKLAAPPPKTDDKGFSIGKLVNEIKREVKGRESFTAPPRTLNYKIGADVTELRIEGVNAMVKVTGDDRQDIELLLSVTSTGETEAAAHAVAAKANVIEDRVGNSLTLRMSLPPEERQTASVALMVPARLAVRLDAPRDPVVSNVRSLEFLTPGRGEGVISKVGIVRGDYTGGVLTMSAADDVKMLLTRVNARISGIGQGSFDVRDGETEISGSRGPLEIEERRGNVQITNHKGRIKVSGTDGQVRIEGTTDEVHLDLRRAEAEVELAAGTANSLVTTDETLRVTIPDTAGVRLDAVATRGSIDGAQWNLTPTKSGEDSRVDAALGANTANAPRVSLRNTGGDIVIRKSSKK